MAAQRVERDDERRVLTITETIYVTCCASTRDIDIDSKPPRLSRVLRDESRRYEL